MTKLLLFGMPRTGTTRLQQQLANQVFQIENLVEPYSWTRTHNNQVEFNNLKEYNNLTDPYMLAKTRDNFIAKILVPQLGPVDLVKLAQAGYDHVVVLSRRDIVSSCISLLYAELINNYHYRSGDPIIEHKTFKCNLQDVRAWADRLAEFQNEIKRLQNNGVPVTVIDYDDFISNKPLTVLNRVFCHDDFNHLSSTNPSLINYKELCINYREVVECLEPLRSGRIKHKFTSLEILKKDLPEYAPFNTQSWVYAGITSYFSQQNHFGLLEFGDFDKDLVIRDWPEQNSTEMLPGTQFIGSVHNGHLDQWLPHSIIKRLTSDTVVITGHEHFSQERYTTLGFDYWDHMVLSKYQQAALYYELNQKSLGIALYDVVIPSTIDNKHKKEFMQLLETHKSDLTIVTDDYQEYLTTDLRFGALDLNVYKNKSCDNPNGLPHKKIHYIARVNLALEATAYKTDFPYCTEETFRLLAQNCPFVIFGDTNILQKLKKQGFRTFEEFCDESYDTETNPVARAHKVIDAVKQLTQNSKRYVTEIDAICRHNQNLYFDQRRMADNLARFGKRFLDVLRYRVD